MIVDEHYINKLLFRLEQRDARPAPPHNVVYVTELVSPCARRVWYARRYPPEVTEVEALRHLGRAVHELVEEALRADGWLTEVSVAINDGDVTIRGRVDAVREEEAADEAVVRVTDIIEIKTVDELPQKPRDEHVHQARIYAAVMGAERYHIVYVSRRNGRVRVFSDSVSDHDGIIEDAKRAARELVSVIQADSPPPPSRGAWCSYCPFRWRCWSGGE